LPPAPEASGIRSLSLPFNTPVAGLPAVSGSWCGPERLATALSSHGLSIREANIPEDLAPRLPDQTFST
ncbi:hypothetical protein PJM53_29325, partial [Mycobacterium kansasii]